jgi:hypothetical protein
MDRKERMDALKKLIEENKKGYDIYVVSKNVLHELETTFDVGEKIEIYDYPFYSADEKLQFKGEIVALRNGCYDISDEDGRIWTRVFPHYIRRP